MSLLAIDNLQFAYPGREPVLTGVSATAERAEVIAIAGPNGAGKSTLLDLLAGQKTPAGGACRVQGQDVRSMTRAALCRLVAHVPQGIPADVPFTVEEVVLTGRAPHGAGLFESDEDYRAMEQALRQARLQDFRGRRFSALSGGEKQRVLVAAALCQEAPVLLLDEPGAHLDPENEAALWELFHSLREAGRLVIVVTHHLALAAQNADRVWLLHQGRLAADGPPREAMRPEQLRTIFHVPFHWHESGEGRVFLSYGR
ncbi:MAG TPA: ABC transporter ATP-binding protein [Bryobacteraceae bacterium]|nr:ABC transporter ATP-binding protein [Bryobacteraceae bacterium]